MKIKDVKLGQGLVVRPSNSADKAFLEQLHNSTREDLRLIDGERDFVESIIDMQFKAQQQGYGAQFPNAMYFIIEKQHERIGKVTIDFGHNEVHVIDIAFIPQARGKGFGEEVIRSLQAAATQICAPLTLSVLMQNVAAKKLYLKLGFITESISPPYERMMWRPEIAQRVMV
ncbi:GNAT family N-acetyltransferase [Hahella aquimaris]|uniref:GNAT family N-acetyltransferase n=1 Tax=Hahella sp. HNIBRBA332 TaxID=3015983 RepID=UPI00273B4DFD|nr:GNAT family N-acetyltransferase [Hahella sp. HNIBRBA332]WLQ13940.1 GNAT family N-acetyltransferase [Hahella sp. HNIBRBA332]